MNISRFFASLAAASVLAVSCGRTGDVTPDVIPYPDSAELKASVTNFGRIARIEVTDSALVPEARFLGCALEKSGYSLTISSGTEVSGAIVLRLDDTAGCEEYTLRTSGKSVEISGSRAGVFYGVQTLLQELRNGGVRQ